MRKITKIKDNITERDFRHLMAYLRADESIRESRQERLKRVFTLLYVTGMRLNELSQLTSGMMVSLMSDKKLKVVSHKQSTEKMIYITDVGVSLLGGVFGEQEGNDSLIFVSERGDKRTPLSTSGMIRDVNTYLKEVFPSKNITSHSFRQSLISDMAAKNVNTKTIQALVGHKDISTTYRYIKPSEDDILNSLELVR